MRDPLWTVFPRWIEESGLPQAMVEQYGPAAWLLFRKLIELDCDRNISPGWFSLHMEDLMEWTGLTHEAVNNTLALLEAGEWIERCGEQTKISTPLSTPVSCEEARARLVEHQGVGGRFYLRYSENESQLTKVEKVVFMYQMVFGAKFSPRIAEDLEEIANEHDLAVVHDVFSEANRRNARSLAWVKSQLRARLEMDRG